VRAPFSSIRGLAGFTSVVILCLLLPVLATPAGPGRRGDAYVAGVSRDRGPFTWIHSQVFRETSPLDIAFMGSSLMMGNVNTESVEQHLSASLGRQLRVRTIAWNGSGFDSLYFIARDLLERRRVNLLIIDDQRRLFDGPSIHAFAWYRWVDTHQEVADLSWRIRTSLYASAVLGTPRGLWSQGREEGDTTPYDWYIGGERGFVLGGSRMRPGPSGFGAASNAEPADGWVAYGPGSRSRFTFDHEPTGPFQTPFREKLVSLCRQHGVRLVVLHFPLPGEATLGTVPVCGMRPELFEGGVGLLGIPGDQFFRGLSPSQIQALYYDPVHMNARGQDRLTRSLLPALVRLHEILESTHPR
jgi:hypothetical protein